MSLRKFLYFLCLGFTFLLSTEVFSTETTNPEVLAKRGTFKIGKGTTPPILTLTKPTGGWTSARMIPIAGKCSDPSVDPILINAGGARYYARTNNGAFYRKIPAAKGKNIIVVECKNQQGIAKETVTIDAEIAPVRFKVILSSDTDNVYTDLHIYEPDGTHVNWASSESPSGGLFFLNDTSGENNGGGSFDSPGYGPYVYVHPSPPPGVFKIDVNYWPGGAKQHTLATLDLIIDEGLPSETRRKLKKPLAIPNATVTLAYIKFTGNKEAPIIIVPGEDSEEIIKKLDLKPVKTPKHAYLDENGENKFRIAASNLALLQAKNPSTSWDILQRDCAGLIRFVYREALRYRSALQLKRLNIPAQLSFPPVSAQNHALFPYFPKMWRIDSYNHAENYSNFADAETIVYNNFRFKSKNVIQAEAADLLVFKREDTNLNPWHLMLVAKPKNNSPVIVVYHNGEHGKKSAVRVASIAKFTNILEPTWQPSENNPYFKGVFEWNRLQPKAPSLTSVL